LAHSKHWMCRQFSSFGIFPNTSTGSFITKDLKKQNGTTDKPRNTNEGNIIQENATFA